jgi:Family of unknown function (DUF6573)
MTIKEARRLTVGDKVKSPSNEGIVVDIKFAAARIQWKGAGAVDMPHDQMAEIDRVLPQADANDFWADATIISAYTRKQAIEDGILVDMTQEPFGQMAREAGITFPIAMTRTAFEQFVELNAVSKAAGNDMKGRWWDICIMFRHAVKRSANDAEQLVFEFLCVTDRRTASTCHLKSIVGPNDDGGPCLTFMLPEED